MTLTVIETRYKGYHFRSRLEARFFIFLDTLNLRPAYEPEGFNLGDGIFYLPDFWLPEQDCWVEIKPDAPTGAEADKAGRLATQYGKKVVLFYGPVESQLPMDCWDPGGDSAWAFYPDGSVDYRYLWCECPMCGRLGITFEGRVDRLPCRCVEAKTRNFDSHRLMQAYKAAQSARFEFEDAA